MKLNNESEWKFWRFSVFSLVGSFFVRRFYAKTGLNWEDKKPVDQSKKKKKKNGTGTGTGLIRPVFPIPTSRNKLLQRNLFLATCFQFCKWSSWLTRSFSSARSSWVWVVNFNFVLNNAKNHPNIFSFETNLDRLPHVCTI